MKILDKVFGELKLSWRAIILFAIVIGIYTGIVLSIPILKGTSFRDIGIGYEWWILFSMLIITNCRTAKEASLKTFVFFLFSQPVIFLVQPNGTELFCRYYSNWVIPTLATLPMAYIGWYTKKDNICASLILSPMLVFLGNHLIGYFQQMHILSMLFCMFEIIILLVGVLHHKKQRILGFFLMILGVFFSEFMFFWLNR